MRVFTAHAREGSRPVLVPERFSWGALLFGPLWLVVHRAWVAAALVLLALSALAAAPEPWRSAASVAVFALLGFCGQDVRRWTLALRGFAVTQIVAAPDADAAWLRLADARPELAALG